MARMAWWMAMTAIVAMAPLAWGQSPGPATRPSSPETQPAPKAEPDSADTPTYITLHVKNAKPAKVLEEISAQAHVHVVGWPDVFWTGQQPGIIPNVTLDLDHVTFWTAIEAVCKATHTHPQFIGQGQPSDVSLIMGNLGTWDQEGLFAIVPMTISHCSQVEFDTGEMTRDDSMTIGVYIDPKLHQVHCDPPHLTLAQDEHGLSMISHGRPGSTLMWGFQPPWSVVTSVPLAFPPHRGTKLARVEGTIVIHLPDSVQMLQIDNVTAAVGKSASAAGQSATVVACSFDGNSTVTLHVRLKRDEHAGQSRSENLEQELKAARIIDATGQQLMPTGSGTSSGTQFDWSGTFAGKQPAKAPFTLRLPIAAPRPPMTVRFTLKDVPLPPQ